MNAGADPNWDGDLFRLYNKRSSAESWQDDFVDGGARSSTGDGQGSWSSDPWSGADSWSGSDDYGRELFGGPGADLFGSRMSGEQPDRTGESPSGPAPRAADPGADSGPFSQSMPSISQPMSPISQSSMSPISQSMPSISGSMPAIPREQPRDEADEAGSLVRPYARTRGRTRTEYDLAIETLVSTSDRGRGHTTASTPEHRSICGLCTDARSVAEVAAHMRLPLGVVRVLIGDMAGLGLVLIHDSGMVVGDRPSMEFLERVLSGLRRL